MSWNQVPNAPERRADGYVNMLNKYGTQQDNSTAYQYGHEGLVPDTELTENYETNGLFAKIIDAPAEEAVKHGFELGLKNPDVQEYIDDTLDALEWEDKASDAIKWARLFGGALGVMFIEDGGGLDEPLNWKKIRGVDEIRIYERAVVFPDYSSLYNYDPRNPTRSATSKFGMPEYYHVNSIYGQFWVHESRCLVFRNGILPERTMNPTYRFWGIPEYVRIKRELREAVTTHSLGVKLLERSVQAIYSMHGLASLLSTDDGEIEVIKRLQVIDMARGLLNSIAIDSEGESYDFKTATMTGVREIVDATCNMLSAVTNIPQTVLFGRSPAGQNSTGESDFENYYNYIERHQKLMLRNNLRTLLDIIVRAGLKSGKLAEEPGIKLTFNPLWSMSDAEQAAIGQQKTQTQHLKAQTAQIYVDMGALDPSEVRKGLAQEEEFQVEELLDGKDIQGEDLWGGDDIPSDETKNHLTPDALSDRMILEQSNNTDDDECRAKDPAKCPYHGAQRAADEGRKNAEKISKSLPDTMSEKQRSQYLRSVENEPAITNDIKQITEDVGGELVGLDFRLKTAESFERKVTTDMDTKNQSEDSALKDVYDVIRYTSMSSPDELANNYFKTLEKLQEKGYSLNRVKNSWNDPENPYKGINVIFHTPTNEPFEVQFHTKSSFDLKQGPMHKLYEEYRLPSTPIQRKFVLEKEMMELSSDLKMPKDVDKIK